MKNIIYNIEHKIEPEINLAKYVSNMRDLYYRNSCVRMTMNYYTYKEMLSDIKNEKGLSDMSKTLEDIILRLTSRGKTEEETFDKLLDIRNKNIKTVNTLTIFTDIFSLYENILNRVEYRFVEDEEIHDKKNMFDNITDEDVTRSVMQYILCDNDNVVINGKISEVMRELPVRMTKNKFYEYLEQGLSIYKNQEKRSIDDFIYMIKTSATLDIPNEISDHYSELYEVYDKFKNTNYGEITKSEFDNLRNGLMYATRFLEDSTSLHLMLQENINDLFVLLLANQHILSSFSEFEDLKKVVGIINNMDEQADEFDELNEVFESLEGKQEDIISSLSKYDYVLDMMSDDYKDLADSLMLTAQFDAITKMRDLSSGSMFVEFDKTFDTEPANEKYIKEAADKLIDLFDASFKENERMVNRSRMSVTLSILPVFFNNISELQDYIFDTLSNCRDDAEKTACKELLLSIVNDMN